MDAVVFYFVIGSAITVMGAIWLNLQMDNERQEKLIKKYRADLNVLRRKRLQPRS
ncbi:hypothetical protein [Christiangramia aquimixticola]|uniref:hypothetical protein n=1 Tax=Christiangramia aquimixticola TaxID=1697558 RepID=UPI003AA95CAA